jgi:hypothetical protein
MKIKIWTAITDGGDGEHHSHTYKSKQEMIDDLELTEVDGDDSGTAFDDCDYLVGFSSSIFDTEGYEVVE